MGAKKSNCFMLILVFFINIHLSFGVDSISANQSLSGDQTIVSSGGKFELGFFKPGSSSNYYIGMWFKKDSKKTVIWLANRERPVTNIHSSELKVVDGNLVLFDETQTQVWSTDTKSTFPSLKAVLLDEGNLVLRNGSSSSRLWQSLDYPSHTWLPGTKIAYDKRTNRTQTLTSWKNSADPAPGLYTLEVDPIGNQSVIRRNGTKQIWNSGAWNGHAFSLVPEMSANFLFSFTYISNENETSFTYSSSLTSRFIMDYNGQIKVFAWVDDTNQWSLVWSEPKQQCEVSDICGTYSICNQLALPICSCLPAFKIRFEKSWSLGDYSGGCVRTIKLECGKTNTSTGEKVMFGKNSYIKLPDNPQFVSSFVGSTAGCKSICLSNCSCSAYAYHDSACFTWSGDLLNMQQLSIDDADGNVIYIRLDSTELSRKSKRVVYGVVGGSTAVVLIILSGLILVAVRRWKLWRVTQTDKSVDGLVAFDYKNIQRATKNFSERLGGGGFGSVFKGTLPDSTVIAVKKLEGISQGEKQFRSEVSTIGRIQHVNLVHLRGFCSQGNEKLLVYEYMPNGSLDSHIFKAEKAGNILSWKARYGIVLGIGKGLVYLHEKCRDCIIHCDIKPENILLDGDMCPKVADFGLAKLVGHDFSRVLTTMRGTRGYLAPEWISGAAITEKADVYSYGMMLFEFVSGRRNMEQTTDGKVNFFPLRAANVTVDGGDILRILDPNLNRTADVEEVTKICRLACWCIQDNENVRPSMSRIVQILEGVLEVNQPPDPRSLQVFMDNEEDIVFFTDHD